MNEITKSLKDRKSVRVFTEKEIDESIKNEILLCAVNAPTAGNQQLYTILDIRDKELQKKLSVTCDNQPFIADAKFVLIFCADFKKWYDAFLDTDCTPRKPAAGDFLLAVNDAVIAAQNAVVAAESFGIGSCYIGDIMENCEIHREMLKLPEYVFPAAMLVFGYPTEGQIKRIKPERADMKHIVHTDTYRILDKNERNELFSPKAKEKSYEDWMKAFCERKYNSDFSVEMSRSVNEYLKEWK
ncbi:MAG: nitroreductase family protein [Clostridia bacterium]|nr:nitroreductase family protein [Clostridia bacterium]